MAASWRCVHAMAKDDWKTISSAPFLVHTRSIYAELSTNTFRSKKSDKHSTTRATAISRGWGFQSIRPYASIFQIWNNKFTNSDSHTKQISAYGVPRYFRARSARELEEGVFLGDDPTGPSKVLSGAASDRYESSNNTRGNAILIEVALQAASFHSSLHKKWAWCDEISSARFHWTRHPIELVARSCHHTPWHISLLRHALTLRKSQ